MHHTNYGVFNDIPLIFSVYNYGHMLRCPRNGHRPLPWAEVIVRCQVSVYGQCISAACRVIPDIRRSCKCTARTINLKGASGRAAKEQRPWVGQSPSPLIVSQQHSTGQHTKQLSPNCSVIKVAALSIHSPLVFGPFPAFLFWPKTFYRSLWRLMGSC